MESARYRDYSHGNDAVREFYRQNHEQQTLAFVTAKKAEFLGLERERMGVWDAMGVMEAILDESDPDLALSQMEHALQTAEAIRAAGKPRWLVLTGFLHDLGKVLLRYGEPQWAVVGDTFPVGCAFSESVVHAELFAGNPDVGRKDYATPLGIYEPGCGLDRVQMSWGHDEYLYHVLRDHLPEEALYIVRYHSFYAAHQERAYDHLMDARDRRLMASVREFSGFDLYSKNDVPLDAVALRPYYEELVAEFVPDSLRW